MNLSKIKNTKHTPLFYITIMTLLMLSCSVNAAEHIYISDNLRVGVRTEPVSGVPPIGVVFTGMRLEVLEESNGYVKIKSDKGLTGWIKDIYVTKTAPAIIQLHALEAKYEKLKKQVSQGSDTTTMLEKANLALSEQVNELKAERHEWSRERASLMASQHQESSWIWVIELIVLVVLSFAGGAFWYRTKAMKRLGGLRV